MHDGALHTSARRPLYQLGDLVVVATETDDGLLADYGYIRGIELDPKEAILKGWWYSIFLLSNGNFGYQEWAHEGDIKGRVIHGGQK